MIALIQLLRLVVGMLSPGLAGAGAVARKGRVRPVDWKEPNLALVAEGANLDGLVGQLAVLDASR